MKYGFVKAAVGLGLCGLLAGCATTVDMGGPLGHYRYNYDSRPIIRDDDASVTYYRDTYGEPAVTYPDTYRAPVIVDRPAVTFYHHDDDD
jgi:hypothetical protein